MISQVPRACHAGGKLYRQMAQGQNTAKVYMRDVASGRITLLVDPSKLGPNGTSEAVNFFQPSQDGQYLAYGISANGSEAATLRVIETTNLEDQNVAISRVGGENGVFLPVSWLPDNSFVYYRRQKLGPNESPADFFLKSRAWLHHLGQNPNGDNDTPIFGFGVDKAVSVASNQDALVKTPPGSNYAFGLLTENESNNVIDDIFVTTTADLEAGKPVWKHIADSDDKVTAFDASSNEIFLITYKDAAHSKIVATDLAAPDMATARTVVPESDAIIRGLAVAKDALYVTRFLDSSSQIIRLAISNGVIDAPQVLALPYIGTVDTLDTNQTNDGAVFELEILDQAGALVQIRSRNREYRRYRAAESSGREHTKPCLEGSQCGQLRRHDGSAFHHHEGRHQTGRQQPDHPDRLWQLR